MWFEARRRLRSFVALRLCDLKDLRLGFLANHKRKGFKARLDFSGWEMSSGSEAIPWFAAAARFWASPIFGALPRSASNLLMGWASSR
jgi:hypothetical protein